MERRDPSAHLELEGHLLPVRAAVGRVDVEHPFFFEVEALDEHRQLLPRACLGRPCVLRLEAAIGPLLVVHGIVQTAASFADRAGRRDEKLMHWLRIELGPVSSKLMIGRDSRYFQELDAVAIAQEIFAEAGLTANVVWEVTEKRRVRPYTAQVGESDWAFLARLFAEEGLTLRHQFDDDATRLVIVEDTTHGGPELSSPLPFRTSGGLLGDESVGAVRSRASLTHDSVALRDYDPQSPRRAVEARRDSGTRALEHYDYPARLTAQGDGQGSAKRHLEALRARRRMISGTSSTLRLQAGWAFEIDQPPVESLREKLFIVGVEIQASVAIGGRMVQQGAASSVVVRWQAVPRATAFRSRPTRRGAREMSGPQTAAMVGPAGHELHPDDRGRIRARFHWDRSPLRDGKESTWMRVGQFAMGGSMVLPRIGFGLLVEHHAGDADAPFVLAHLYDGAKPPPYALPEHKSRTSWQTATTPGGGGANEIRFEDKKGSEEMFLNASKDMQVTVGDAKTKKVGNDHAQTIGANLQIKVGANRSLGIVANHTVSIGATETVAVSGNRALMIGGNDTSTVGASRNVTATDGKTIDVDGNRTVVAGANMMSSSLMGVTRTVVGSSVVVVGGAWITTSLMGLSTMTMGAGIEAVGAVKLQAGLKGVSMNVMGALTEVVGAAYVAAAGGDFGETATGALTIAVGGAFLLSAPTIELEAETEITITCGASSLVIKPDSIELNAPTIPLPLGGPTAQLDAGKVQHNA